MNDNQKYLDDMFNEITKYEERSKDFGNWFQNVSYDQVKDGIWYKNIEGPVINHLAQKGYTWFAYHSWWFECSINECKIYQELMAMAGLEYRKEDTCAKEANVIPPKRCHEVRDKYKRNIRTARKKLFEEIDEAWLEETFDRQLEYLDEEYHGCTPAEFVYGKKNAKYQFNYDWRIGESFGNNYKFRAAIFKIVKKLDSFKEKAKTKPEVDFYNLIRSESFADELENYFEKTNDERKSHKLKKLFSYVPEKSINATELSKINPKGYFHSVAYDEIHGASNKPLSPYYCPCSELVFYSLVEFYGKDFFAKLPEDEKNFIREFYKEHPKLKLSDPSIIKNSNHQNEKLNNLDKSLNQYDSSTSEHKILETKENGLKIDNYQAKPKDNINTNEILKINENEEIEVIEEKSDKKNLFADENEIKNQPNNLTMGNDTKLKSKTDTIKQNKINTKVIGNNLGNQDLLTDNNEISMTDNNIKLKSKSSDTNTLNNIVSSKNKQSEILNSNTEVIKNNLIKQNLSTNKNEIYITDNNIKSKFKKIKKSYTKARVGTVILGISFVISLILAWQISIYILIASAILLAILIIYLIALKKNGFECTKIFCCCMDVEDEPQKENSKDNNLSNPKLNKTEIRFQ